MNLLKELKTMQMHDNNFLDGDRHKIIRIMKEEPVVGTTRVYLELDVLHFGRPTIKPYVYEKKQWLVMKKRGWIE